MSPISNWTELDVWQYVAEEELEVPSIHFADDRVTDAAIEDRKRQGRF